MSSSDVGKLLSDLVCEVVPLNGIVSNWNTFWRNVIVTEILHIENPEDHPTSPITLLYECILEKLDEDRGIISKSDLWVCICKKAKSKMLSNPNPGLNSLCFLCTNMPLSLDVYEVESIGPTIQHVLFETGKHILFTTLLLKSFSYVSPMPMSNSIFSTMAAKSIVEKKLTPYTKRAIRYMRWLTCEIRKSSNKKKLIRDILTRSNHSRAMFKRLVDNRKYKRLL